MNRPTHHSAEAVQHLRWARWSGLVARDWSRSRPCGWNRPATARTYAVNAVRRLRLALAALDRAISAKE